ncbi:MAG: hypothetical protein GX061_03525 [Eubacteriaceae bacterium]|nr:hypothetical protein [Eubacteriaceae bacterium]
MAVRRRVRENPKREREFSGEYRKSPWKVAFICVLALVVVCVGALIAIERSLGYLPSIKSLFSFTSSAYKVTLPADGSQKEIYPGQSLEMDIIVTKKTGSTYQSAELPQKYKINMFFSDASLCDREDYLTIYLHGDVAVGTVFSVNVTYEQSSSTVNFTVVAPPAAQ